MVSLTSYRCGRSMSNINFPTGILFVDPRTNQRLAGAKLSFFFSGTSTPLSAYQDAQFVTPWVQPIVADANGNFPPNVYLNPGTKAKIQLANSSGAVQWLVDPYYIPLAITVDSPNIQYDAGQNIIFTQPPIVTPTLTINSTFNGLALRLVGGLTAAGNTAQSIWRIGNATTGAQNAVFTPSGNKPGPANSTPAKWLPIQLSNGGATLFAPCFL